MKFLKNIKIQDNDIKIMSDLAYEYYFGTWVNKLWPDIRNINDSTNIRNTTFQDEKEIFFRVFEQLLEEGKIIVFSSQWDVANGNYTREDGTNKYLIPFTNKPNIPEPVLETFEKDKRYTYWNADAKYIVDYIRYIFPQKVEDKDDVLLENWFYGHCPLIGWVNQETGEVTAS